MTAEATDLPLPLKLVAVRHGVTFSECLDECIALTELVEQFDRLYGANLCHRGSPLELAIDKATGKQDVDMAAFIDFCWNDVFLRFGN